MFRGTPDLSGVVDARIGLPLELRWDVELEDPVLASPVSDGERVYVGDGDGNFVCLALADGEEAWRVKTDGTFESTACIVGDLVIVGSTDGFVYAWNKSDGSEAWKFETMGEVMGGINVVQRADTDGRD